MTRRRSRCAWPSFPRNFKKSGKRCITILMDLNAPIGPSPVVVSESREPEADNNLWKLLVLFVLGGISSVLTAYFFLQLLVSGDLPHFVYVVLLAAVFVSFAV